MSSARALIGLSTLWGCTDHLVIGGVEPYDDEPAPALDGGVRALDSAFVDAPLDAPSVDTRESEAATAPMRARLVAFGREDISALTGLCGAPCAALEVEIEGGAAPFEMVWSDNVRGPKRELCPGAAAPITVEVEDARGLRAQVPVALDPGPPCSDRNWIDGGQWRACITPNEVPRDLCGDGAQWWGYDVPVSELGVTVKANCALMPLESAVVAVSLASSLCGPQQRVGRSAVDSTASELSFFLEPQEPFSYIVVQRVDDVLARLAVTVDSCFSLEP